MKVLMQQLILTLSLLFGLAQGFSPSPRIQATTLRLWATAGATKEAKLTREAQEVLDAFSARDASNNGPDKPLIVAQVAPAVR